VKKVSVIIASYNGEATIEKTIQSILNQDGVNEEFELELLVVDDCSTDKTEEILNRYNLKKLSTGQNTGGPNKGRNIGLGLATGDIISISDQDDIWEKHKLITLIPYLEKVPIVSSGYTVIDNFNQKKILRTTSEQKDHILFNENETFLTKLSKSQKGQNTYLGSLLFRSELKSILFEENFGCVDFDWVLRLFHQNKSIEVCQSLYNRYVNENNLSLDTNYRRKDFYYSLLTIEQYEEAYPKETLKANKKIHGSRARYYYLMDHMKKARFYFFRSEWNVKTFLYILTSFIGASLVKKHFNIFG